LSPRAPWPQDDGGRVVLWQDLLALAGRFETRLVVMHTGPGAPPAVPAELVERGVEVSFVKHRIPSAPVALVRGALGRWPYTLARFHSRGFDRGVRAIVNAWRPDLVFINNLHLATYVDALDGCVKVLREQNLEQLWLARYAQANRNPAVSAYAWLQARRMRRTEAELCGRMDLILAMHDEEASAIRVFTPGVPVEAVPVGASFITDLRRPLATEPTLLLIGSFDREPNAEGAKRFLEEGWPIVRARVPGARLRIIGRQIPAALAELARLMGAEPVGFVPDLAGEFARAWALVIPIWVGAGVRVKMVEAIAAGVPVVSTPLGAEGLSLEPGRHFVIGDTGAELGRGAADLLGQPARAAQLAADAHAFMRECYGVEAISRRTVELCQSALVTRAGHRAP
jgi:glycosyltransferase involved in cell wall biosynthesis